jgi:hypothetical protein
MIKKFRPPQIFRGRRSCHSSVNKYVRSSSLVYSRNRSSTWPTSARTYLNVHHVLIGLVTDVIAIQLLWRSYARLR